MLDSFRKASQSWYVKVLFVLLILSFGVWGIGDVVRMRASQQPAIVVGKQEIAANDVAEEFRRDVDRLSQMTGGKLTMDQARQFGLLQRTIEQMVSRSLLDQAAEHLKLGVDDATLRQTIAAIPAFQNELHVFDKNLYERALIRAGFNERQFVAMERSDLAREQLNRLISAGIKAPTVIADPLFRYRNEQRVAEAVSFPTDRMPTPAKPGDAALEKYYKDHSSLFMAPEMRGISAIVIRIADVAGDINPSDEDIEKSYQVRQAEFQSAERRSIQQVLFDDQAKAQAFVDAARQAPDFAAAAKSTGRDVTDLGWVERKDLPLPALADAAFGAPGGIVGPIETPLGWHVLRIASVVPVKTRPLSEVRSQIVQDLVKDEATNRLYALSTKLEDAIGSGAGIDEAAASLNVKPLKVAAMDQRGGGPDGKPAAGVPLTPAFLAKVFQTPQGATSDVAELEGNQGYFVLHVDQITAPAVKPYDTVKDQVLTAWTTEQKAQIARQQADAAAERLRKGDSLAAVAGQFKVETTKPFHRSEGDDTAVPPLLAAEMFKQTQPGGVAVVSAPDGAIVARLKSIIPADPKANEAEFNHARDLLSQAMVGDVAQQYVAALQRDMGVHINNAVIDQQFQK